MSKEFLRHAFVDAMICRSPRRDETRRGNSERFSPPPAKQSMRSTQARLHAASRRGGAIAAATNVKATAVSNLLDIDYGEWTGKTLEEVERADPERYALWWRLPQLVRPPKGDSLQDLMARTAEAVREIIASHPHGRVVVVGHDSTNRAPLLTLLDLPPSAFWRFQQSPCNLTEIDISPNGVHVDFINETLHLSSSS